MEAITPGHLYALDNFEPGSAGQTLQFIQKEPDPNEPTKLVTTANGTTNEEVILMLIDRCTFLYNKFPSTETLNAIACLEEALTQLQLRTRDRLARGVEGKHQA